MKRLYLEFSIDLNIYLQYTSITISKLLRSTFDFK
uniref:Uncharacterized protein n=1 Tax=Rhizophora mucronata TaxID=61149 RepID=A0A2P2PS48_RHIMU